MFTARATGKSVAPRSCWSAGPLATRNAIGFRRRQAIDRRSGASSQSTKQGKSAVVRWLPNPRLQWTGHTTGHVGGRAVSRGKLLQCQG